MAEIYGYNVPIMFPDHIRFFLNKGEAELERKNGMHVGTAPCLAPLLVKGNHWVLLEITPTVIRVQDSLRTHTAGQAKDFAHHLQEKIHGLRKARVYEDTNWPQQGYGTNDCALFVMRAILQRASGLTTSQVQQEFSREFLDATLPRFAGTATSSKDQGALPETQQRQFIERLRRHLTPAVGSPVGSQEKPAVASTVPVDNAPAVKDPPAPQPIPTGTPPSAPAKDTKAATTGTAKGSPAVTAKSVAKDPTKAVASAEWVKCGQPKCKYDKGMVSSGSAWACSLCYRPFHPVHFSLKAKQEVVCSDCRRGSVREATTGSYAMPKKPPNPGDNGGDKDGGAPPHQDFQRGQGSPCLAMTMGKLVSCIRGTLRQETHPLAAKGITAQARTEHLRLLRLLIATPTDTHDWPVGRAALEALEQERVRKEWCWATVENKTGMVAAALSRLRQYSSATLEPVLLRFDPEWVDAGRHIRRLARQTSPTGLPAVQQADIVRAITEARNPEVRAMLILAWATVGRCGDVSQVKTSGVTFGTTTKGRTALSVFFERGKVIGKLDPYHVHTAVPLQWAEWLRDWCGTVKTVFLFQRPSRAMRSKFLTEVRDHLRTINPRYDLRAVRRGSAQTMAESGVPLSTILTFTKHADVKMLRRYLRFGKTKSEETRKGTAAASALWQTHC